MNSKNKKTVAYLGDQKLELSTPLKIGGKDITEIVIKEPKVKDLKAVSHIKDDLEQTITLIANKSGFTIDEVEDFPTHIYMKLQELVKPFLS
ncbi:hypothetical protein Abu_1655 [Aliarcobacter butzleri RM4018]|uniref:Phage tail assembly protein n=1 Tax=Aliarcobacter butzleri (strain RM4018) TaxID=367737 RepID=A8EVC9_ALIB4|nr:phage tail assembly protein [Aliarcobacter butzleri]ABV67902.1 hypothetical protein Abu_1655 [Aliarcobacter butzleri RM4018]GGT78374.1 hypothetical protein GCM10007985_13380 [Aliarcobacter butzleri]SNV31077.1 Uncharacterised protein [Aliarcobacter butzleri]